MVARTSTRLTRSSPPNIKKFEFDRIHRSQQRLLFRKKRSARAPAAEPKRTKKVSFLLPEPRNKCDRHQQRWRKVLRSRTHNRRGSSNPHLQSKQKPDSPNLASSERLQECSIYAVKKGKRRFPDPERSIPCSHSSSVCKSCLIRHTVNELQRHGHWSCVTCIVCKKAVNREYLDSILSRKDLESLDAIVARQIQDQQNVHDGYTCDSHPIAVSHQTPSEKAMAPGAKWCPDGCRFYVAKDGEYDVILCSRCGRSWNWVTEKWNTEVADAIGWWGHVPGNGDA